MSAARETKMAVAEVVLTRWGSQKRLRPLLVKLKAKWFSGEEAKLWIQKETGVLIDHLAKSSRKDAM